METFENNDYPQQPQEENIDIESDPVPSPETSADQPDSQETMVSQELPQETSAPQEPSSSREMPQPSAGREPGTGRKKSPYADSPYVTQRQPEYHYQPQTAKPPKEKKTKPSFGAGRWIIGILLTVALVAAGCGITASSVNAYWEERMESTVNSLNDQISALEDQIKASAPSAGVSRPASGSGLAPSEIYAKNADSVVTVTASVGIPGYFGISEGYSSASGFIIREDGYVVTNCHVVEDATDVTVTLNDGTEYPAQVVGSDSTNDVAVLKIEGEDLPAVTLGSSDDLMIGDMVVAIGNHLSTLAATQTVGYVSGINREVTTETSTSINMLQTDAVINSGSSGGPLFNMRGEVVGITTAKYSGISGSGASIEGISFAIPIDDVEGMISDLIDFGYVTGAYLGVTVQDMDPDSVSMYGLPMGAYVVTVVEGGSADRAGVKPKDIITGLGDYTIGSITELTRTLRNFKAGEETSITVVRGGKELTLSITLDERPRDLNNPSYEEEPEMPDSGDYDEWYEYFRRYFGQ